MGGKSEKRFFLLNHRFTTLGRPIPINPHEHVMKLNVFLILLFYNNVDDKFSQNILQYVISYE